MHAKPNPVPVDVFTDIVVNEWLCCRIDWHELRLALSVPA